MPVCAYNISVANYSLSKRNYSSSSGRSAAGLARLYSQMCFLMRSMKRSAPYLSAMV